MPRNDLVESTPLQELGRLFARAYLRLLAQHGDAQRTEPAGRNPLISVDSSRQQRDELVTENARGDGSAR